MAEISQEEIDSLLKAQMEKLRSKIKLEEEEDKRLYYESMRPPPAAARGGRAGGTTLLRKGFSQPKDWQFEEPPIAYPPSDPGDPGDPPVWGPEFRDGRPPPPMPRPSGYDGLYPEHYMHEPWPRQTDWRRHYEPLETVAPLEQEVIRDLSKGEGKGVLSPEEWENYREGYVDPVEKNWRQQKQMDQIKFFPHEFTQGPDKQREDRALELADLHHKWAKEDAKSKG